MVPTKLKMGLESVAEKFFLIARLCQIVEEDIFVQFANKKVGTLGLAGNILCSQNQYPRL